ncbi:MAG: hypothetical protein U0U67_01990 [Chitinophagales bacterium]
MQIKKTVAYLLLFVLFFSCNKDEFVHPDYIIFGSFGGFCSGDCRYIYYLDDTKLLEDSTKVFFENKELSNFSKQLSAADFDIAKDLINKVPTALTKSNRTIFVDINTADQNIYYVQILLKGRTYVWTFDNFPNSTPSYLKPLADEVLRVSAALR